ncbi:MAG TPA: DUF2141 domain-containing protein [Saprospiraceae bacterium]|nr:DUF2141 domain-containing protein [Saprospiraceae bacterium]
MRWKLTPLVLLLMVKIQAQWTLSVELEDIKHETGKIFVAIYDNSLSFRNENLVIRDTILPINKFTGRILFNNMPSGEYAVTLFHDVNDNGKLDTNILGIPKEPYGFSNNPAIRMKAPNFEKCKFTMNSDLLISIIMK